MNPPAAAPALLLGGRERERFPWFLFFCVVLSFAAHAGSFLVFQVIYPQRATLPPPPPQVQLLSAASAQYPAIMSWVEAEDPALVASARGVQPANLLEAPYRPSFAVQRTAPRGVPEAPATVQFPAARNPLAIIRSADPQPAPVAPAPAPLSTRVSFSPPLAERGLTHPVEFSHSVRATAPVEPSSFLLGVTGRGEVRFIFLQRSSGNIDLDTAAARALGSATFAPSEAPIIWSHANITWGDDALADSRSAIRNPQSP